MRVRVAGPVIRRRACIQPRRAARPSVQLASGQRRDERTVSGFIFPLFREPPSSSLPRRHQAPSTIVARSAVCSCARIIAGPASCSRIPRSPPARAGFPARKPNRKQKFFRLRLRLRLRATIVAVRASYYSTTPPAGARRRRALSMPPLPRPPQPRHRITYMVLGGYCRNSRNRK